MQEMNTSQSFAHQHWSSVRVQCMYFRSFHLNTSHFTEPAVVLPKTRDRLGYFNILQFSNKAERNREKSPVTVICSVSIFGEL